MTEDAKFEDAGEAPLHLKAFDREDLQIMSALVQDAVFPIREMTFDATKRRFGLLLNRFRWEDAPKATARRRPFERVQAVLAFEDVLKVQTQGFNRSEQDMILSLLSIEFTAGEDGAGRIELVLAGDGAIALEVEALEVTLKDVTKPYIAPSGHVPHHDV
ncbi:MAG: DUF2948 family protein [Paracoccaceae bacterium]|nr:DUF2948 family protein [Paracoccaceae bacterium]